MQGNLISMLRMSHIAVDAMEPHCPKCGVRLGQIDKRYPHHFGVSPDGTAVRQQQVLKCGCGQSYFVSITAAVREIELEDGELYPCDNCGTLRTKAEGGTTFTVCDACWGDAPAA